MTSRRGWRPPAPAWPVLSRAVVRLRSGDHRAVEGEDTRQLGRWYEAARSLAAPTAGNGSPGPAARWVSCRRVLACLGLLLVIVATAGAVSWWSWQTLQDRRVQLGAEQQLRRDQPNVRSLTNDLVRRNEVHDSASPSKAESGPGVQRRDSVSVPAATGGGISVPGHLLAGLVVAVAFSAAAGASWLVVQRYRRAATAALSRASALLPWTGTVDGTDTVDDTGVTMRRDEEDGPEPAVAAPPSADGARDGQPLLATLLVPQREPDRDERLSSSPVSEPAPGRDELVVPAGARHEVEKPLPAASTGYDDLASDVAARQRLYERRVSQTVSYVQPGWLWWAALNAPVTVRDVSETGLRCVLSTSSGPAATQPPALGERARVFFPVAGSTVKVGVHVTWKDATAEGTDLGLDFTELKQDDAELLRRLLDPPD